MSNNIADSVPASASASSSASTASAPATSLIRSKQVSPLPIGSGGNNPIKQQMNQTNTQLTMLSAQASANTKYDPPTPQPVTTAVLIENFCSSSETISSVFFIVGGLLIVYGIVAK